MSLVIGIISPRRAAFLSDGFALGANGKIAHTDFSKIFRLPGGQLLTAIGNAVGIRLATRLQASQPMSFADCRGQLDAFMHEHPEANCSLFLVGRGDDGLEFYGVARDETGWKPYALDGRDACVIADGFFANREEVGVRCSNIGRLLQDGVLSFDQAVEMVQGQFDELRARNPRQIGGQSFCESLSVEDEPVEVEIADCPRMIAPPAVSAAATTSLSQPSDSSTSISVGAGTYYMGNKTISANSGSVDPGAYGTWYIYFDDPGWGGGAVTYQATSSSLVVYQNPYRIFVGVITTSNTGSTGGGVGSVNFCFSPGTRVKTQRGDVRIVDVRQGDFVLTARGTWKLVKAVTTRHYRGDMLAMGASEFETDEFVTSGHLLKVGGRWVPAEDATDFAHVFYDGTIHNLHIETSPDDDGTSPDTEHSYTLANGRIVHNVQTA